MKPLYLEIEGVKSVSDKQTIDFERVAKSGIFGVFGKTELTKGANNYIILF